jgi:peptidoglycan-associated lipoprotein
MKSLKFVTFLTIGLIACLAATGCKKKPGRTTPMPTAVTPVGTGNEGNPAGAGGVKLPGAEGTGVTDTNIQPPKSGLDGTEAATGSIADRDQDHAKWKDQTVYFDFDRSVVKASETAKIDKVAAEFKNYDTTYDLLVEGHCDERGTPQYNLALGERRAQALREYLIKLGVNGGRIYTISFGKDKPEALGHDEASWSKNRRGAFVLVLPKKK